MTDFDPGSPPPARISWPAVGFFYFVACLISWPLFWWRDLRPESWAAWGVPGVVKGLLPAFGPLVGSIITPFVFPKARVRTITLWGTSLIRSLLFAGVTIAGLTAVGVGDDEPHLTGLYMGFVFLAYGLLEESGWRGFLEDALTPLTPLPRYVTIGVLWGTWHFTTFTRGRPDEVATRLAIMYPLWVFASWGLGKGVLTSKSLIIAAMLHLVYNFSTALPRTEFRIVIGTSIVTWIILLKTWNSNQSSPNQITNA